MSGMFGPQQFLLRARVRPVGTLTLGTLLQNARLGEGDRSRSLCRRAGSANVVGYRQVIPAPRRPEESAECSRGVEGAERGRADKEDQGNVAVK